MKHISTMTEQQIKEMTWKCEEAARRYAQECGFSGLSHAGWFSFYSAIQEAIMGEWLRCREGRKDMDGGGGGLNVPDRSRRYHR